MSLFLFPARIRWSNPDGTLTPEAYRALQALLDRVGGPLGDQGTDSFSDVNGDATLSSLNVAYTDVTAEPSPQGFDPVAELQPRSTDSFGDVNGDVTLTSLNVAYTDVTANPSPQGFDPVVELQPRSTDSVVDLLMQPLADRAMSAAETVTPGASPATVTANRDGQLIVRGGTVSQIDYVRNGTASTIGVTAGLFSLLAGDGIRITYSVAPTVTFIPR